MRIALLLPLLPLLAAASCGQTKLTPPPPVPEPVHTVTVELRYVPIDAALTAPCDDVRGGKPSEIFDTAKRLREALGVCSARLQAVGRIQGTPVKDRP